MSFWEDEKGATKSDGSVRLGILEKIVSRRTQPGGSAALCRRREGDGGDDDDVRKPQTFAFCADGGVLILSRARDIGLVTAVVNLEGQERGLAAMVSRARDRKNQGFYFSLF